MTSVDPQRAQAARIAARARLREIRLYASSFALESFPDVSEVGLKYDLNMDAKGEWAEGDPAFLVRCSYEVVLRQAKPEDDRSDGPADVEASGETAEIETDDEDGPRFASIEFTFGGIFELELRDGDAPPTKDELEAYAATTGSFAMYPFAREYVRDVTSRMGVPQLTLGVALQPITRSETGDAGGSSEAAGTA